MRRNYAIRVFVNRRWFNEVIIDPHYEKSHRGSINDELILELVKTLHKGEFEIDSSDALGFEYHKTELILKGKPYRLIWLTHPDEEFIGVRTVFRRRYAKMAK
jgi:hypothetical protein